MGKKVLDVRSVSKVYGKQKALDDVNISINQGEVVGLVGPNGAGKSTLMKIIVGLIRNYDGVVEVNGEDILKMHTESQKKIGCVIENPGFYPELSGYDNLLYFSKISGCSQKEDIEEAIDLFEIREFIHKKVKKYSLGMKQRLGLAQAVLGNPKLLVLDEPTNGLDPNIILSIRNTIKYLSKEKNVSIIISSHILSEVESMCSRVYLIKNGKIIEEDSLSNRSIESKNHNFIFETESIKELLQFFNTRNIKAEVIKENKVRVCIDKENVKEMLPLIIKENINISGMYEEKESLEQRFMDRMGGNIVE